MWKALRRKRMGFLRAGASAFCALAILFPSAAATAASGTSAPPRPKGVPGEAVTSLEAKALADWALAQPEVALRFKGHRTRLLHAGLADAKEGKSLAKAVLSFRDYDAGGIVRRVSVDLETGGLTVVDWPGALQPSGEELAEGMAIVLKDPGLARFVRDPTLTLMGGFHNRSPHPDDPCARDFCLEFAFMKPGPAESRASEKRPPRRVIVNLTRGAVVNRDYRANADPGAPTPRMTAEER